MTWSEYTSRLVLWRTAWLKTARPTQLPPARDGSWDVWLPLCGRGWGKTRVGAEETGYYAAANDGVRCAVVAPSYDSTRAVCFEGESGLLAKIPSYFVRSYHRQNLELRLINDSLIAGISADRPDKLRGPQWHMAWADEMAAWPRIGDALSNLRLSLRLGQNPWLISTTTPRPRPEIKELAKHPRTRTIQRSTFDNSANLAASALAAFRDLYEGTRLGRQELDGEILEDLVGALWSAGQLDACRVKDHPPLARIVVAVDPAVTSAEDSDEWGIVVAGRSETGVGYVLEDASGKFDPATAARVILSLYDRHKASSIVAETNQGGDLVQSVLKAEANGRIFHFKGVHAKRGKFLRAEPIAALYTRDRVRHVGPFNKLENQMITWNGATTDNSPDRLDALVYALGDVLLEQRQHYFW